MSGEERRLRVGVLGCGPIAQFAHLDACRKARNAELYAICDHAADLVARMAAEHAPRTTYAEYDAMLADPLVEAVIVATTDAFHVPLARRAIAAGKHVLVEKPLGVSIEECERLRDEVAASGLTLRVGHNLRFDPGAAFAHNFVREEMGAPISLEASYHDSTDRHTMTDNLQPIPVRSTAARRPDADPRADRRRYFLTTHGSHLFDMARFLGGPIDEVCARHLERADAHCWFVECAFASGALGHLDLTVPARGDFGVAFRLHGEGGSVDGRLYLPWYRKAGHVECFSTADGVYRRPLGADAYTYKLQIEGLADAILGDTPSLGATVEDGLAVMRAMVSVARSCETGAWVRLDSARGEV